jgi:tetratricopeptide (TPR) repeat protein
MGDYQEAERLYQESLTIAEEIDERRGVAMCLSHLGYLAYDRKDYLRAERLLQESLTRYQKIGNQFGIASTLCHLGHVASTFEGERVQEARQYFRQALTIATEIGARPVALNVLVGWATLLSAGESEDSPQEQAIELLVLVLYHPASEQETKDRANRLLDELASSLPPESVAAARERGKARKFDTTLKEALEIHA